MFTGQCYDAEIEEYYLRGRQYNPHLAGFTARYLGLRRGKIENGSGAFLVKYDVLGNLAYRPTMEYTMSFIIFSSANLSIIWSIGPAFSLIVVNLFAGQEGLVAGDVAGSEFAGQQENRGFPQALRFVRMLF